jgi:hypothetical protein
MLLGLDLSLAASAAVAVPLDWDGQWSRVRSCVAGEKLRKDASDAERARRTETIAARLVGFARTVCATSAWVEGYAFGGSTHAHSLGELGGVVRLELVRAGIELHTVNMGTARKFLLGKCPPAGAKVAVCEAFRAAGARFETLDEYDAMAVANWGLSELGGYCFAQVAA